MKFFQWVLILMILVLLLQLSEERKKKKSGKNRKTKDPKSKRPDKVSAELFCDACTAILSEAMKELRGKKKESDVINIMERVCDPEKYNIYHFPPPEMREGCEAFVSAWNDEIPKVLINRADDKVPIQKLCFEITKACEGVDFNNMRQMDDTIMIDGEPMKMSDMQQNNKKDEESTESTTDL